MRKQYFKPTLALSLICFIVLGAATGAAPVKSTQVKKATPFHSKNGTAKSTPKGPKWTYYTNSDCIAANPDKPFDEITENDANRIIMYAKRGLPSNDSLCYYYLGLAYDAQGNYSEAVKFYRIAAINGNVVVAQINLGVKYEYGNGVEQNYNTAKYWYDYAMKQCYEVIDCDQDTKDLIINNATVINKKLGYTDNSRPAAPRREFLCQPRYSGGIYVGQDCK